MKGPSKKVLTVEELAQVAELEQQIEEHFNDRTKDQFIVNTNEHANHAIPRVIWEELVLRANEAGWRAELRGAMVYVNRP